MGTVFEACGRTHRPDRAQNKLVKRTPSQPPSLKHNSNRPAQRNARPPISRRTTRPRVTDRAFTPNKRPAKQHPRYQQHGYPQMQQQRTQQPQQKQQRVDTSSTALLLQAQQHRLEGTQIDSSKQREIDRKRRIALAKLKSKQFKRGLVRT